MVATIRRLSATGKQVTYNTLATEQERTYHKKQVQRAIERAVTRSNRQRWRNQDVEVIERELVSALGFLRPLRTWLTQGDKSSV